MVRTIVEEDHYAKQLASIEADAKRADELIFGITWLLARDASMGSRVSNDSRVWMLFSNTDNATIDSLTVYHTFDSELVYLLSIERTDNK